MNLKLTIVVLLVLTFGNSSSMIYCENFEKTRLCDTLGGTCTSFNEKSAIQASICCINIDKAETENCPLKDYCCRVGQCTKDPNHPNYKDRNICTKFLASWDLN